MRAAVHNAEYTKRYNRNLVMRLLISQPLSRAELARQTGLTRQTLTNIADEMLSENLIVEEESAENKKGRVPLLLNLKSDAFYAIGVYLSRIGCQVGLVNIKGQIIKLEKISESVSSDNTEFLHKVTETIEHILQVTEVPRNKVLGIGISSPGPVQQEEGIILNPPGFERWHNTNVVTLLEQETGLWTMLENNAYSLATYEKHYGKGKDIDNFMLLLVDSGVGCGIISNGHLYKGTHRLSGEIGHTSINFVGERCSCGNYGCLELYAAIPNLLARFSLPEDAWPEIVLRAKGGDIEAVSILNQEADYLVAGIVNAVNMLDVEAIILDGDIIDAFDFIQPYMEKQINSKIITRSFGNVKLLSSCGHYCHQVSAAANIIFSHYFVPNKDIK